METVEGAELLKMEVDLAYEELHRLAHTLPRETLQGRREALLSYVRTNRARFVRTLACVRWLVDSGHNELIEKAKSSLSAAEFLRSRINRGQDELYFMHGRLFSCRGGQYDVQTAIDVLMDGGYPRLPRGIVNSGPDMPMKPLWRVPPQGAEIARLLERAMKVELLCRERLPEDLTERTFAGGCLCLTSPGRYTMKVTMEGQEPGSRWVLTQFNLLVAAAAGELVAVPPMDLRQKSYLLSLGQMAIDRIRPAVDEPAAGQVKGGSLAAAHAVFHEFTVATQLELLSAQARKLAELHEAASWYGSISVVYHREAKVLDILLWGAEFATGVQGTGGYAAAEGGVATPPSVNGVPTPSSGRFARAFISGEGASAALSIQIGPCLEGQTPTLNCPPSLSPSSVSASALVQQAVAAFAVAKAGSMAAELSDLISSFCDTSFASIRVEGPHVTIGLHQGGQMHVEVDTRSGRCLVNLPAREEQYYRCSEALSLAEALNLLNEKEKRRQRLLRTTKDALRLLLVQEVEGVAQTELGMETQRRWGLILGRLHSIKPEPGDAAATPSLHRTYLVLDSSYQRGSVPALTGTDGAAAAPSGERLMFFLEVDVGGEPFGARSMTLLMAAVSGATAGVVPLLVHQIQLQSSAAINFSQWKQTLGAAVDQAERSIPWLRLERALKASGIAFPIPSPVPRSGEWVPVHLNGIMPSVTAARVRWQGQWREWDWELKLSPASLAPPFSPVESQSCPPRVAPLRGLTVIGDLSQPRIARLSSVRGVPLQAQCRAIVHGLEMAGTLMAPYVREARHLMGVAPASSLPATAYRITSTSAYHVVLERGDGTGKVVLSHKYFTVDARAAAAAAAGPDLVLLMPSDAPLALSKGMCDCIAKFKSIGAVVQALTQVSYPVMRLAAAVQAAGGAVTASGPYAYGVLKSESGGGRRVVAFQFAPGPEGFSVKGRSSSQLPQDTWSKKGNIDSFDELLDAALKYIRQSS